MSETPLTDTFREHEDLDSLDDVIASHEKLELALAAKTAECERMREDALHTLSFVVAAEGGRVSVSADVSMKNYTLTREQDSATGAEIFTTTVARKETP
jgi:hypothetical protein